MTPQIDAVAILPEIVVTATLMLVFVIDLFITDKRRYLLTALAGTGAVVALGCAIVLLVGDRTGSMLNATFVVDDFALLAKILFLLCTTAVFAMGAPKEWKGEYLVLTLAALLGMLVIVSARELITFVVAFELLAIPGYMLTGWQKRSERGHEGALKYYLLGMVATAVMLYGVSLLFGIAGATDFATIATVFDGHAEESALARLAVFFVIAGMAFKFSAVPFHFWTPDAYQGAPIPVAAFLSIASKTAGLFALAELLFLAVPNMGDIWAPLLVAMAAVTMTVGNVIALRQTDLVRLLAYSSIAQAGYALVPLAVAGRYGGTEALALEVLYEFLFIYVVMNIAVFAVVAAIAKKPETTSIDSLRGLFFRSPVLALFLAAALLSLAGLPPFGGWFAKLVIFRAGIEAGGAVAISLVVVAAINTAIGLYYYAAVVARLWARSSEEPSGTPVVWNQYATAGLATTVVIATGMFPAIVTALGVMSTFGQ